MYTREDPYQVMSMQDFSSAIHITTNKPGLQAIKWKLIPLAMKLKPLFATFYPVEQYD